MAVKDPGSASSLCVDRRVAQYLVELGSEHLIWRGVSAEVMYCIRGRGRAAQGKWRLPRIRRCIGNRGVVMHTYYSLPSCHCGRVTDCL